MDQRAGPPRASGPDALEAERPDTLDTPAAGPAAIRGGALRTGAHALGILLSLLSAPLLIRHLGVEDFGRFAAVTSVVLLVGGLTDLGVSTIAVREYTQREGDDRDAVMRALLGLRLVVSVGGVVAAVAFAVVAGYGPAFVAGAAVAGVGLITQGGQAMYATALQGRLRYGWLTSIEVGRSAAAALAIIALVLAGAGVLSFFVAQTVALALAMVATMVLVRSDIPLAPAFRIRTLWPAIRATLPVAAAIALQVTYFRVALIGMSLLATALETGYFATSFRILEVVISVPVLAIGAAFPILARSARDDAARFDHAMRRVLELAMIVGVGVSLVLVLGAPAAIAVLAGDSSEPSVDILRIQAAGLGATFLAAGATYLLLSLRRERALLLSMLAPLASALVLTIVLVPRLGGIGAAIATLVAELSLATAALVALSRAHGGVLDGLRAAPAVAVAAALALGIALVPGVPAAGEAVVGAAVYTAALWALGRFPPEVRELVRRRPAPGVPG